MADEPKPTTTRGPSVGAIARLGAQRGQLRAEVKTLTGERDTLRSDNERLARENAELKTKADGSASLKRVQELEGQIRESNHRKAFDRVAKARGVADDALDLVYQTSGYKAEGDQADEAAIGALIDATKAKPGVSRLFGDAPAPDAAGGPDTPKPALGAGQAGRPGTPPSAIFAVDDPRHSDVKYMMANYEAVSAAAAERIKRGEV